MIVQEGFGRDQDSDEEDERRQPPKHLQHGILQRKRRRSIPIPGSVGARVAIKPAVSSALFGFLYPSLLAALVLTGIHAHLGVHIVERGVIFAGLSLAQIAALGTAIAYLTGHDLHSGVAYF